VLSCLMLYGSHAAYAVEELRRLKRQQAKELLALGIQQTGETLTCCRADGEPLQPRSLTHQCTLLRKDTKGLPRMRYHDTRHTHATQLLADGVHPKVAQERLGHLPVQPRHRYDAGRRRAEA
jgi:integrase